MFQAVLGIAEHQESGTYGLEYKFILKNFEDLDVPNREGGADIKVDIKSTSWYIPQYAPSIPDHSQVSKQCLSRVPTELRCIENLLFREKWTQKNGVSNWEFEVGLNLLFI